MSLVDRVAELVRERAALQLDAVMRLRLVGALEQVRVAGEGDEDLLQRLRRDPGARQVLYDELTVQETSFFRDPGQFEGLAQTVLPLLRDPVTIWSAGCSNGQEAYSLAMLLAEQGRAGRVVATDLSERALARTREGRYAERELRGLSPERRARWLVREGDSSRVVSSLRAAVEVRRHNLAEDAPVAGCSVVFCRNVLIYFSRDDVVAVVRRFAQALPQDGWLFLGFSETLWTLSDAFTSVRLGEAYAYRPAGAGPLPAPAPARPAPAVGGMSVGGMSVGVRRPGEPAPPRPAVPVLSDLRSDRGAGAAAGPSAEVAALLATGERALRAGLADDAVTAFRGAAYLAPDLPLAHLELGLALYALGERAGARRALQTARRVLTAGGDTAGWDRATLARFVDERLAVVEAEA